MKKAKYRHTTDIHNTQAAEEVVSYLVNLLKIKSVVDVGCGLGTWLKVFSDCGIDDYLGIEGSHLDKTLLVIPKERIVLLDLEKPFTLDKKFDLVLSLEVAEHLDEGSAGDFISSLTRLGLIIMFSAAIPYQGGQNHINEQWPDYWEKLFANNQYQRVDILRKVFWDNKKVDPWYKQNIYLYIHYDALKQLKLTENNIPVCIHPEIYNLLIQQFHPRVISIKTALRNLKSCIKWRLLNNFKKRLSISK